MILEHSQFMITKQINLRNETKLEFCSEKKIISRRDTNLYYFPQSVPKTKRSNEHNQTHS
jgi:hypothetical protein